jgi:hypothetical protein
MTSRIARYLRNWDLRNETDYARVQQQGRNRKDRNITQIRSESTLITHTAPESLISYPAELFGDG